MRLLYLSLFVGLAIVLMVKDHPGYVLINFPPWVVETALPVFILLLVGLYLVVSYLVRLISTFLYVRQTWGSWHKRRLGLLAQAGFAQGLLKTWAGRWEEAEKQLLRSMPNSAYPALNLLTAAHAAQQQGGVSRRDRYLDLAKHYLKDQDLLVLEVTQAELQLESGEHESALRLLQELRRKAPKNVRVMRLLASCYYKRCDWDHLTELLHELHEQKIINKAEFSTLEIEAHAKLLEQAVGSGDPVAVANAWIRVPFRLREHEAILPLYVRSLRAQGEGPKAEQLLLHALKRGYSDVFVHLYGLARGGNLNKQLNHLEKWLAAKPRNAVLLQAAARVCLANRLWGKARSYLEAAIGIAPTQEMYKELGDLLEIMGESQAAVRCYKQGLHMAVQDNTVGIEQTPAPERELRLIAESAATPALPRGGRGRLLTNPSDK